MWGGILSGLGQLFAKLAEVDGANLSRRTPGMRALNDLARFSYPRELPDCSLGFDRSPPISVNDSFPKLSDEPVYRLPDSVARDLARASASRLSANGYRHLLETLESEHCILPGEARQFKADVYEDGSPLATFERLERAAMGPPTNPSVELSNDSPPGVGNLDELVRNLGPQAHRDREKFRAFCETLLNSTLYDTTKICAWACHRMLQPRGIPTVTPEKYSEHLVMSAESSLVMHIAVARAFVRKDQIALMPQGTFEPIQALYDVFGSESVMLGCAHNNFKLDAVTLREAIKKYGRDKIGCIVITNPTNALGNYYSVDELRELAQVAVAHDLLIVSDDIYSSLAFPRQHAQQLPPSIAAFDIEHDGRVVHMHDRVITIYGFSKILADDKNGVGLATCGSPSVVSTLRHHIAQLNYLPTVLDFHRLEARIDYCQEGVVEQNRARFQENFEFMEVAIEGANSRLAHPMISRLSRPEEGYLTCLSLPTNVLKPFGIEDSFSLAQYIFAATGIKARPVDGMGLGKVGEQIAIRVNFCEPEQAELIQAISRLEGLCRVMLDGSAPTYKWATSEIERAQYAERASRRKFTSFGADPDERK